MKYTYCFPIALIALLQGCTALENLSAPSAAQASREIKVEEFELPYSKEYIYDRWSVIQTAAANSKSTPKSLIRSTSDWVPDTYGPFGYEGGSDFRINPKNKIARNYSHDLEGFNYCIEACTINIHLIPVSTRKTEVRIEYTNTGGDVQPFVDELSNALRYFLAHDNKSGG